MKKINNMRDKLLYEKFYEDIGLSNVEMTFAGMIGRILTIPSYSEIECCNKKMSSAKKFPFIQLNNEVLKDDLANMEYAIESNFIDIPNCTRCKKKPQLKREFANHVFVEVRYKFRKYSFFLLE